MSTEKTENPLVTFYLKKIVEELLGDADYCTIKDEEIAEILLLSLGTSPFHIQLPSDENLDIYGKPIESPRLWRLEKWRANTESWLRARAISDRERNERRVFEANVNLITRLLLRIAYMTPDAARMTAHRKIKNKEEAWLRWVLNGKQLFTDIKDI